MDFPVFHLDFMGNRWLIAVIAILHVLINHAIAVGFAPLVTLLEYRGYRAGKLNSDTQQNWDKLAYKLLFVAFIITTSVGAMTGVGIWFSAALVNPGSIGSLIRVFYFAWFFEWIIFVLEVVFIMYYFLTWKKSNTSLTAKKRHLRFGLFLAIFSWVTMAVIVGILGFMMDPGNWLTDKTLWSGFTNPLYIPQLLFRTPLAMIMAGTFGLLLTAVFTKRNNPIRIKAFKFISIWTLIWVPHIIIGGLWYYYKVPSLMLGNIPVAVGTQLFQQWYQEFLYILFGVAGLAIIVTLWTFLKPRTVPKWLAILPLIGSFIFLGSFERVREFIRKPFVIGEYMYANTIRAEDYDLLKRDGLLKHCTFVGNTEVTANNKLEAGRDVFLIACTRCHTTNGINSVVNRFERLYGHGVPLQVDQMTAYMRNMHNARYYMPPFPGNEKELYALAHYIKSLQEYPQPLEGAQLKGTDVVNTNPSTLSAN